MICKTMKMLFSLKLRCHSGLFFKHLCLGCLNPLCCLSEIFKPTPHEPSSGDARRKEGGYGMYRDTAREG